MAYNPQDDDFESFSDEKLLARFGEISRQIGRMGERLGIGKRTIAEVGVEAYGEYLALPVRAEMIQEVLFECLRSRPQKPVESHLCHIPKLKGARRGT